MIKRKNKIKHDEIYELVNKLLIELKMKPAQREVIRAFLQFSKGKARFEISAWELANALYKVEEGEEQRCRARASYAAKGLIKWQDQNKVQLVSVVREGQRSRGKNGAFIYKRPQYGFVLLKLLVKAFKNDDSVDAAELLETTKKEIYARYKPTKQKPKLGPNYRLKNAKATMKTKIEKVFECAVELNKDPETECLKILKDLRETIRELTEARKLKLNQNAFINDFEAGIH